MGVANNTKKKGKKVHKNENDNESRAVIFARMISVILAAVAAIIWNRKLLSAEEALALFTMIGGAVSALGGIFSKNKLRNIVIIICIFIIGFAVVLFFVELMFRSEIDNTDNTEKTEVDENQGEEPEEEEEHYVAKEFVYELDVLFGDLVYYVEGHEIEKNDRSSALENLIHENLNCGKLPERYEDDSDKLNSGVYAQKTNIANEYYDSYMAVKDKDIDRGYKLEFLQNARENRRAADDEYVTIENSINLVWACEAERYELGLCIAEEDNAERIKELEKEAKECNREIMKTVWNIMLIEYCLGKDINKTMAIKLVESYEWERDHKPDDDVDYNEIIDAFKNVLDI
ncbi:hypothetical protein HDR58_03295 [bacterium]|nr:hypothetical protein [bacterium]